MNNFGWILVIYLDLLVCDLVVVFKMIDWVAQFIVYCDLWVFGILVVAYVVVGEIS